MRRNGWSEAEIKKLEERTGKSRPHFHLDVDGVSDDDGSPAVDV
jgi:hypothetical protein